jgi:hypothetical protein
MGYPGGIFDPLGFSKGNFKELQTKEIKNGRLAMVRRCCSCAAAVLSRPSPAAPRCRRSPACAPPCQPHAADRPAPSPDRPDPCFPAPSPQFAFAGFILQAQATGQGPLANLSSHLSNPFGDNITKNIGTCAIPSSVDVQGLTIPLTCLWPGQH